MNQFTIQAQRAIQLALESAEELHHSYVGTEHLLLGLRRENTALAAKALAANGIEEDKILEMISKFISPDGNVSVTDRSGYTPGARRIMEASFQEAQQAHSALIGTEHILLSILKDPNCAAARIINTLGGSAQRIYQQIMAAMGAAAGENAAPVSYTHLTLPTTSLV